MDGDIVLGILMIAFWVVSSLVARFGRKVRPTDTIEGEAPPGSGRGVKLQDALRELADQMGLEVEIDPMEAPVASEPPVPSEHRVTTSEHQRTAPEARPTVSEHVTVASEHQRTASETRRTASEKLLPPGEHQWSPGEHVRGDHIQGDLVAARPVLAHDIRQAPKSDFARRLRADLAGGKGALARAMVLKEILGPPVSLRPPGQEHS